MATYSYAWCITPELHSPLARLQVSCLHRTVQGGNMYLTIQQMKQAFDLFDKNHDGKISSDELGCVLRTLGHDYCQDDVDEMIKNADTNEFTRLLHHFLPE
ncbi:hypothetical protein KUTeg_000465 [Tegillarca granosa]|uniref:EF-hand domain-containing protein n=1 Tax=Tegillarca granosa TaxID=220873 RepID=A0ABQ9FXN1_TEGGR|nr:hypothetical protein KUTeg_000465 [Tegillarca granosa]